MRLLLCVWWYTKVRFSDIWRKNNLTSGTDQVPSFLLKDCASVVIKPLTFLFNLALSSFTFPNVWKIARVCSVLKSGEPSFISNYRAISIFSNVAKFVEIVLCSDIRPAKIFLCFNIVLWSAVRRLQTTLFCAVCDGIPWFSRPSWCAMHRLREGIWQNRL